MHTALLHSEIARQIVADKLRRRRAEAASAACAREALSADTRLAAVPPRGYRAGADQAPHAACAA